ncbi:prepilin peptidase, partial [Candidatus Roizmanbacteria bacterium]|nr:prepilin peptidase [Candidatus Roizmanbacteria bacterium]
MFLFLFLLGTAVGSFLNVLIDRLPNEESIHGRSHCNHCRRTLRWFELIPLFSFLFLQGKCRTCKKPIPLVYFFVELLTGVMFVAVWNYLSVSPVMLNLFQHLPWKILNQVQDDTIKIVYLVISSCLVAIFFTDAKYQIIPDSIQLVLFLSIFVLFLLLG